MNDLEKMAREFADESGCDLLFDVEMPYHGSTNNSVGEVRRTKAPMLLVKEDQALSYYAAVESPDYVIVQVTNRHMSLEDAASVCKAQHGRWNDDAVLQQGITFSEGYQERIAISKLICEHGYEDGKFRKGLTVSRCETKSGDLNQYEPTSIGISTNSIQDALYSSFQKYEQLLKE